MLPTAATTDIRKKIPADAMGKWNCIVSSANGIETKCGEEKNRKQELFHNSILPTSKQCSIISEQK